MSPAILLAFILDLLVGDPRNLPHPVRLIGRAIEKQETFFRNRIKNEVLGGSFLFFVTVLMALSVSGFFYWLAGQIHPVAGFVVNVLLIFWSLSLKSLSDEATAVRDLLRKKNMHAVRERLAGLVGRDTDQMDEEEAVKAGIETISENLVDGVISPLFFAALGGGPLAMAYKAVNTCDSMVGYRNTRYEKFGKVSAISDDAANFIPARLSILFVTASAFLLGLDYKSCFKVAVRDRLKHPSPNSAHAEAAFAGALGVQLGGDSLYGRVKCSKPLLGNRLFFPEIQHLTKGVKLMRVTSLLAFLVFALF